MNDLLRDYARWNRVERVGLAIVAAIAGALLAVVLS
jgi:hypothetical protein